MDSVRISLNGNSERVEIYSSLKYKFKRRDWTNLYSSLSFSLFLFLFDRTQSERNDPLTGSFEAPRKKRDESHKHLWVSSTCCNKFRMIVVCIPPMRAAFFTRQLRPASARFFGRDARLSLVRARWCITITVNRNKCPVTDSSSHVVPRILRQLDYAIVFLAKATEPYWFNSTYRLVNKSKCKRRKEG